MPSNFSQMRQWLKDLDMGIPWDRLPTWQKFGAAPDPDSLPRIDLNSQPWMVEDTASDVGNDATSGTHSDLDMLVALGSI